MPTFQEYAAENLAGFGLAVDASEIPDYATCAAVFHRIAEWWGNIDATTLSVIGDLDLAPGLWQAGFLTDFPALYNVMSGNPFVHFGNTMFDILASIRNANEKAIENPGGVPGNGVQDVIDAGNETQ